MKTKKFLLFLVMQMLLALPIVAQEDFIEQEQELFMDSEFFINDIVAKPLKASVLDAKGGDTINDYQAERQFIDNYLKQINPNFSAGDLKVSVAITPEVHLKFDIIYKQIPVDGYALTLHPLSDTTYVIMGANLFSNDIETTPIITKGQAVEKLKLANNLVTDKSILLNELVVYKALGGEPCLCYKIEVLLSNLENYCYYISAVNGEIIKKISLEIFFSSEIGTAYSENEREHKTNFRRDNDTDSANIEDEGFRSERHVRSVYLVNHLDKTINVEMHRDSLHDEYYKWHLPSGTQNFTLEPNDTVYLDTFVYYMKKGVRYFFFPGQIFFDKFVNSYDFIKINCNSKQYEYTNHADIKNLLRVINNYWYIVFNEEKKKAFGWE